MANNLTKTKENDAVLTKAEMSQSERFTEAVLKEFGHDDFGALRITEYQKSLVRNYFIEIDKMLKTTEAERIRKNKSNSDDKYNNDLPYSWNNVNLSQLATGVMHYARMGLDMAQPNQLFPIPYKNNKDKKYDIALMIGYNGIRYIAEKYAVRPPVSVTIEVVYENDVFKPIKRDAKNEVENYEFEITNPFDRGKPVGGFGYIQYAEPTQNELIIMNMNAILKRKPSKASANFWGGKTKKKNYDTGKWEETEEEGWFDEMVRKTIIREVFSGKHIPVDPSKIDANYQYMKMAEARLAEAEAQSEINDCANNEVIDFTSNEGSEYEAKPVNEPVAAIKSVDYSTEQYARKNNAEQELNVVGSFPAEPGF